MKKFLLFCIIIATLINTTFLVAQSVLEEAVFICDNQSISTGAPIATEFNTIMLPCGNFPGAPNYLTPYLDFYQIVIQSGTTFTFNITPDAQVDYDFASWLNPDLNNLGVPDRSSQNNPFINGGLFSMGLSLTDLSQCEYPGSAEDGFVRYYDVQPGDIIIIAVDRWQETDSGYHISFGGNSVLSCSLAYHQCDDNQDGLQVFDLFEIKTTIEENHYLDYTVTLYDTFENAETGSSQGELTGSYIAYENNNPTIIVARLETQNGNFVEAIEISLSVFPIPAVNPPTSLFYCTSTGSNVGLFNLSNAIDALVNDPNGLVIRYYNSLVAAENGGNSGLIPYPNNYFSPQGTVYVRFENQYTCYNIQEIHLVISEMDLQAEILEVPNMCISDQENTIDLTAYNEDLTNENYLSFTYQYYLSENDALLGITGNAIQNPEEFTVAAETIQTIYVRISMGINCAPIVSTLNLTFNAVPELTIEVIDLEICSGEYISLNAQTNGSTINWYDSEIGTTPIHTGPNFSTPNLTESTNYWVEAFGVNGCISEKIEITITVYDNILPEFDFATSYCINSHPTLPEESTNGITGNWYPETIDTSIPGSQIYTFTPNDECALEKHVTITIIDYIEPLFTIETTAYCLNEEVGQVLPIISENGIIGTWTPQEINTTVQGTSLYTFTPAANQCSETFELYVTVHPTPEIEMEDNLEICHSETYEFEAPLGFENYVWTDQQGDIISNQQSVVFTSEGIYTLEAFMINNPCPAYQTIEVAYAEIPVINNIVIELNTVIITATGTDPLEYSLNLVDWQDAPIFTNITSGTYYVHVRNSNGCISDGRQIHITGIPQFITPNEDGYHDTWDIPGISGYPEAHIEIYDRYGKLLYSRKINNVFKWDGKYNGRRLPSSTYWYCIELGNGKKITGHIALKN